MVFHPVTSAFFTALAPLTSDGAGSLLDANGNLRHPMVAVNRVAEWIIGGTAGITISAATVAELHGSTARRDGTYTTTAGAWRWLGLTSAGSCEPSSGPPPAP